MDRDTLATELAAGRSIESIAREAGRHASTVSYWAKRHGLTSAHAARHAARGGLAREELEPLIAADLTVADIATAVGRSVTTVRHWLRYHGLETTAAARRRHGRERQAEEGRSALLRCRTHGTVRHVRRPDGGWRCTRCNAVFVAAWRRRLKQRLVAEAGGACAVCGYDRCQTALQFHHLDPATKRFSLSHKGLARSYAEAREEAQKCVLLCANCHAEVEAGFLRLSDGQCTDRG
jgi:transposase